MAQFPELLLSIGLMPDGTFLGVAHRDDGGEIVVCSTQTGTTKAELFQWFESMVVAQTRSETMH